MNDGIKEIIADVLGLAPEEVTDDFSRETADNWDSLNHLRIITAIEQSLGISLTMDEIQAATSLRELSTIVARGAGSR